MKLDYLFGSHGKMAYFHNVESQSIMPILFMFNGFGCPSIICEFDSLIDQLKNEFEIVAIDYLGSGMSSLTESKRTLENVTMELYEIISEFRNRKIYMLNYSIGAVYCLAILKYYKVKIEGFIAIEPTIPNLSSDDNLVQQERFYSETLKYYKTLSKKEQLMLIKRKFELSNFRKGLWKYYYKPETLFNDNYVSQILTRHSDSIIFNSLTLSNKIPTLIFNNKSKSDIIKNSFYVNGNIFSKVVELGFSHGIHHDYPEVIIEEIVNFINSIEN